MGNEDIRLECLRLVHRDLPSTFNATRVIEHARDYANFVLNGETPAKPDNADAPESVTGPQEPEHV